MAVPMPYAVGSTSGTDHALSYSDDTHAPLGFYGLVFHPGTYRRPAEPVGLAVTLASLLGVNAPRYVTGRVPTEAVATSERLCVVKKIKAQAAAKFLQPASRNLPQGDD